jgi:hypothetical protein
LNPCSCPSQAVHAKKLSYVDFNFTQVIGELHGIHMLKLASLYVVQITMHWDVLVHKWVPANAVNVVLDRLNLVRDGMPSNVFACIGRRANSRFYCIYCCTTSASFSPAGEPPVSWALVKVLPSNAAVVKSLASKSLINASEKNSMPQLVWCTTNHSFVPSNLWLMTRDRMASSVARPPALRITCASLHTTVQMPLAPG